MEQVATPYLIPYSYPSFCPLINRVSYYKFIGKCFAQFVLQKSGCNHYKRLLFATEKFQNDADPLVGTLSDSAGLDADANRREEIQALKTIRQEYEAKLADTNQRIAELEANNPAPPQIAFFSGPPPPPPPMPTLASHGPPPPPPPGVPELSPLARTDILPFGMKPKKQWQLDVPLKRMNWKKIQPEKLSKKAFWFNLNEERLESSDLLDGLSTKFSSKSPVKKTLNEENAEAKSLMSKKSEELKLLDDKLAQNLSILLGGPDLKSSTNEEIKQAILDCNESVLTENVLQELLKYLPPSEQLKVLEEYRDQYENLNKAEQFVVTLASIDRLVPRLEAISFKQNYLEKVEGIKSDIDAATLACKEIRGSKKFANFLELVLLVGNYLNTGTTNAQAVGFEISYLPELIKTKDAENKTTLLHYLVDVFERKFADILNLFSEEVVHVDQASRVTMNTIQEKMEKIGSFIENLETDVKNANKASADKFLKVMGHFVEEARKQFDDLQRMSKEMKETYSELAEYFVFDPQYTLDKFFEDIKRFKDSFDQCYKENCKPRETEEKDIRAREATHEGPPPNLPFGMKPKKEWQLDVALKQMNWKKIQPEKLLEKSFWIKVENEDRFASPDLLEGLRTKFISKLPSEEEALAHTRADTPSSIIKIKELKVLNGLSAQNLLSLLGGPDLKSSTNEEIKQAILDCNESVLSESVQELIEYLPKPEQLKKLEEYKEQYENLDKAEQFAVTLASIDRLVPRLEVISFKQKYPANKVEGIKSDIDAVTLACKAIRGSKKFANFLELVLLVGNYLNTGTKNAQAVGFEISYLPELIKTKDAENKTTLLHYLVDVIVKEFANDILKFSEELVNVDKASRVSMGTIQETLKEMDSSIRNLEAVAVNIAKAEAVSEEDKFLKVMGNFVEEARKQSIDLQRKSGEMKETYSELAEYFVFDPQYILDNKFFLDIKTFKDAFDRCHKTSPKKSTTNTARNAK